MNKIEALKPCPFCGNDGNGPIEDALHIVHCEPDWQHEMRHTWSVQCDKCTATMGYSDSEEEAVEAWNARAYLTASDAERESVAYRIHAPEDDYYGTGADRLQFHPLAQYDLDNGYRQTPLYADPLPLTDLEAENARLRDRLAEALKALEPFAEDYEKRSHLAPGPDIDHWPIGGSSLTYGHLRSAYELIHPQIEGDE